jgi:tetratricopeptide (TPR) repeat protein
VQVILRVSTLALLAAAAVAPIALAPIALAEGGKADAGPKEQFKDVIQLKGVRNPLSGVEIVSETWEKLDYKAKTGPVQSKPASEASVVKYGDVPADYERGLDAMRAGRWEDAETQFRGVKSAVEAGKARKFWETRAAVHLGECRLRRAMKTRDAALFTQAAETFQEAAKAEPKNPLADRMHVGLAQALAGAGKHDDALKGLDDFRKAAADGGRPLWEAAARLARAKVHEDRGGVGEAAQEYADLAAFAQGAAGKTAPDSEDRREIESYRIRGLVGQGWALFARAEKTKSPADVDAAKKHFDSLPGSTGGAAAGKAAALNGAGGILLLEGKAAEALDLFVQVEVTMFAVPDEVARALWQKAQACDRLGDGAGKEQALKDLAEYFPGSEWANRAR